MESEFPDEIKQKFFQAVPVITSVWLHHLDSNKMIGELHKGAAYCFESKL